MERNLQQGKRVPSTVYWRRRIVLLTIVGVLLWLITGWLFGEDPATRGAAMHSDAGGGGGQVGDGSRTAARAASGSSSKSGSSKGDDEDEGRNAARNDGQGDDATQAGQGGAAKRDAATRDASKSAAARGATTSEKTRRTPNSPGTGKSGTGKSGTGKPALSRCATDAMAVTARPAQAKARAGKPVPIELTVENSGDHPCRVPPRQDEIRVVVMAGSDRVTDTARCPAPTSVEKQRVKPGKSTVVTVQWNGRRDTADCSAAAPAAKRGTYTVQASVFGALSEPTDFELR